ncbi:MAG TPA: PilZ domain-containing protein [Pirellulales bacterium]|nr:PilZ domain-containing protein [Pirellulales bacterium]
MTLQRWAFTGRRPRHPAADDEAVSVSIERPLGSPGTDGEAQLVDLSRQGARLVLGAPPAENEPIVFRLSDKHTGIDLALPGAVRWLTKQDDGRWLIGCEFTEELSLEMLGELFLCGILCDRPSE